MWARGVVILALSTAASTPAEPGPVAAHLEGRGIRLEFDAALRSPARVKRR